MDEWLGSGWADAVHPKGRVYAQQQWQEAADSRTPVNTRFRLWNTPSQTWHCTQVRAIPPYHDDEIVRS